MDIVKRIMLTEQTPQYTLRAKTGWALRPAAQVGWWVGWVERADGKVFVFATNIVAVKPDSRRFGPARMQITRAILEQIGAIPQL